MINLLQFEIVKTSCGLTVQKRGSKRFENMELLKVDLCIKFGLFGRLRRSTCGAFKSVVFLSCSRAPDRSSALSRLKRRPPPPSSRGNIHLSISVTLVRSPHPHWTDHSWDVVVEQRRGLDARRATGRLPRVFSCVTGRARGGDGWKQGETNKILIIAGLSWPMLAR